MSELMDRAIIGMPYDMAMRDDLSRRQFYNRAQEILAELEVYRAAHQQPEPVAASQGEEGREVVACLMRHREEGSIHAFDLGHTLPNDWEQVAELMTVAQHERIVAAKDAEIAGLRAQSDRYCNLWNRAGNRLAAQPARQVGVDEREQFEAFYVEKAKTIPLSLGNSPVRYAGGQYVNDFALFGWMAWCERAALAPAAVVPEKLKSEPYTTIDKGCKNYKAGWNAAINEFARLNRRAIPAGLLERVDRALDHARKFIRNGVELGYILMPDRDTPDTAKETLPTVEAVQAELRALLGK